MDTKKILIVIAIVLGLVVVIASYSLMNTSVTPDFDTDLPVVDQDFPLEVEDDDEVELEEESDLEEVEEENDDEAEEETEE